MESKMQNAKLRIKIGHVEVEFEGSEEFITSGLPSLLEKIATTDIPNSGQFLDSSTQGSVALPAPGQGATSQSAKLSTTDFAAQLGVKSGTELVMAAAAYLHHTQGMEDFSRSQLLSEMKSSRAFYKASYGSNLSKSLDTLVKSGRLQNPRADTFALPYREIEVTQPRLS